MEIRKLGDDERGQTRVLWEEVFTEDTKEFLDYYYEYKIVNNQIYVIEEDGAIRSMLQLNPYYAYVEKDMSRVNYIVAVATQESYRRNGYMGKLLCLALGDLYWKQEPFAFLMPAAERIYTPYEFVTVTSQIHYQYNGSLSELGLPCVKGYDTVAAKDKDCEALAKLTDENLKYQYDVSICRDSAFFQRLIKEQESQNGHIVLVMKDDVLEGYFMMSGETGIQIREPIMRDPSVDLLNIMQLSVKEELNMMVRIVHLQTLFECMKPKSDFSTKIEVFDSIISENTGVYQLKAEGGSIHCKKVKEVVSQDTALTISELTGYLFGKSADSNLSKLESMSRICLHEIV
ncbi:MAG: GNAT family N-acetyltransferase [Lachnospiraceae bacterium]